MAMNITYLVLDADPEFSYLQVTHVIRMIMGYVCARSHNVITVGYGSCLAAYCLTFPIPFRVNTLVQTECKILRNKNFTTAFTRYEFTILRTRHFC